MAKMLPLAEHDNVARHFLPDLTAGASRRNT
jgi:hypothetical protein